MTKYVATAGKWAWRMAALAAFITLLALVAGPVRGSYDPQGGLSKVIYVQPSTAEHRLHQWELFCVPKIVVDTSGVRRYQYGKTGCEYARAE